MANHLNTENAATLSGYDFSAILSEIDNRLERIEKCLKVQARPVPIKDAAKFLGVSVRRLHELARARSIVSYLQGRKRFFFYEDLIQFVKEGRVRSLAQIDAEAEAYLVRDEA